MHGLKSKSSVDVQLHKYNAEIMQCAYRTLSYKIDLLGDKVCYLTFFRSPSRFVQTTGTTFCVKESH